MEIIVLKEIDGLAQNFLEAPRTLMENSTLEILYDYEQIPGNIAKKAYYLTALRIINTSMRAI